MKDYKHILKKDSAPRRNYVQRIFPSSVQSCPTMQAPFKIECLGLEYYGNCG